MLMIKVTKHSSSLRGGDDVSRSLMKCVTSQTILTRSLFILSLHRVGRSSPLSFTHLGHLLTSVAVTGDQTPKIH